VDERIGECGVLASGAEVDEPRVSPRPFVRVDVAAVCGDGVACPPFATVEGETVGSISTFDSFSPVTEGTSNDRNSSESLCSSHAAS
jgi:hypothetical protein